VKPMTTAPPPIPVGVPSELLERRPDIAAAERAMAEGNAQIGIAYAAYYPNLTLSASGGFESSSIAHWLSWPSRFWSVGASLSETVFDAGLRRATVQQYVAPTTRILPATGRRCLPDFSRWKMVLPEVRILSKESNRSSRRSRARQTYLKLEQGRYDDGIDPISTC